MAACEFSIASDLSDTNGDELVSSDRVRSQIDADTLDRFINRQCCKYYPLTHPRVAGGGLALPVQPDGRIVCDKVSERLLCARLRPLVLR